MIRVLQADYSISCDSKRHRTGWTIYAWVMLFIYPIGVPALYAAQLFRYRFRIDPNVATRSSSFATGSARSRDARQQGRRRSQNSATGPAGSTPKPEQRSTFSQARETLGWLARFTRRKSSNPTNGAHERSPEEVTRLKLEIRNKDPEIAHLLFLFVDYKPECFYFVVFECVRKLMLTGLIVFVHPGSASQIIVGLLISVTTHAVTSRVEPYAEDVDNMLADVGGWQIMLVFFASLGLYLNNNTTAQASVRRRENGRDSRHSTLHPSLRGTPDPPVSWCW